MSLLGSPRLRTIAWLAAGAFVIMAALAALQAFNTSRIPFLTPQTTADILVFTAMSVIVFLLLLMLLVLLIRNILKLFVDQRSRALGSRLRTRLVIGAALIALAPAAFMFLFSFQLLNRSVDRWFSQPTSELRENSTRVVLELAHYASSNARLEAEAIAASGAVDKDAAAANAEIHSRRITLEGGFVAVFGQDKQAVLGYQLPSDDSRMSLLPWLDDGKSEAISLHGPVLQNLLTTAQRTDEPILIVERGQQKREYATGIAASPTGKLVVVGLPMPQGLSETASQIRIGATEYWTLFRSRNSIRTTYFFMLLLITTLVFFSSMWLALFLSKQITRPVEALADAMDEIADGRLDKRVAVDSSGEMAELVSAFNHMAHDLETSRHMAESSREQLSAANQALEERRRELETILETIPSGVVTLDKSGAVLLANRAFAALVGHGRLRDGETSLSGHPIETLFPADCADDLARVIRRSHRMGAASTEIEMRSQGRVVHLAVTSARLELGTGVGLGSRRQGSVLVVEDTTELLRAQRQLAWKEVAQRVAHEIKNPLTPIALSAERIRKHLDRATADSPSVMRKCSEVILGCVGTLRTLVDQFAALAQFPAPQPRPCDMNRITEDALLLFSGRMEGISIRTSLEPGLPMVMADPDAIKRALANLIDNAAEAMQTSLLKVLTIETCLSEDGSSVEVAVSDTGHGLTDEIRERLFLPFYSTKQRGTGLGLSIAAKIAQEHHGSIRAESNSPQGARFLLCLPVIENGVPVSKEIAAEVASNLFVPNSGPMKEELKPADTEDATVASNHSR